MSKNLRSSKYGVAMLVTNKVQQTSHAADGALDPHQIRRLQTTLTSGQHRHQNNTARPHICWFSVVWPHQHFWGNIWQRATTLFQCPLLKMNLIRVKTRSRHSTSKNLYKQVQNSYIVGLHERQITPGRNSWQLRGFHELWCTYHKWQMTNLK